jgi:hypothetical protein
MKEISTEKDNLTLQLIEARQQLTQVQAELDQAR